MADVKQIITRLEDAVKRLDRLAEVLFYITTIDERRSTLYDTLKLVEHQVVTLNDGVIHSLYERVLKTRDTYLPRYEQILQTDHNAFLKRLSELWSESAIESNEADIALKEALGLNASNGLWGPKGWHPPFTP
ncbi:MAG: hypothetical protein Q8O05_05850 [Chloroflexota bacterium]|nr:hypothetical protein [Chloroflexota bacterium]